MTQDYKNGGFTSLSITEKKPPGLLDIYIYADYAIFNSYPKIPILINIHPPLSSRGGHFLGKVPLKKDNALLHIK